MSQNSTTPDNFEENTLDPSSRNDGLLEIRKKDPVSEDFSGKQQQSNEKSALDEILSDDEQSIVDSALRRPITDSPPRKRSKFVNDSADESDNEVLEPHSNRFPADNDEISENGAIGFDNADFGSKDYDNGFTSSIRHPISQSKSTLDYQEQSHMEESGLNTPNLTTSESQEPLATDKILAYKSKVLSGPGDIKFQLLRKKLNLYHVGTGNTSLLHDPETAALPDMTFLDSEFRLFEKALKLELRLKQLESKEQLSKKLLVRDFRFKMWLERELCKIGKKPLFKRPAAAMIELRKQYKNDFVRRRRFDRLVLFLDTYRLRVKQEMDNSYRLTPFCSGRTPLKNGRRYIGAGRAGNAWTETRTLEPIITVKPQDSRLPEYRFSGAGVADLAVLDEDGIFAGESGFEAETKGLGLSRHVKFVYRLHSGSVRHEFVVGLVKTEFVSTISMGRLALYLHTSNGLKRVYCRSSGVILNMSKEYPAIAAVGGESFEFLIHLADAFSKLFFWRYQDDQKDLGYIKLVFNELNEQGSLLKGIFLDNRGRPALVTTDDMVYIHDGKGLKIRGNIREALNKHNTSHRNLSYVPLGLEDGNIQLIVVRDSELETRLQHAQTKINDAERRVSKHKGALAEISSRQAALNLIKRKTESVEKTIQELEEQKKEHEKHLEKAESVLRNRASVVAHSAGRELQSSFAAGFPFPLPPPLVLPLEYCVESGQNEVLKNAFNAPRLLLEASEEKQSVERILGLEDQSFADTTQDFMKFIGDDPEAPEDPYTEFLGGNADKALAGSAFEEERVSALLHDKTLLRAVWELLKTKRVKLAFLAAQGLRLHKSFHLVKQVCTEQRQTRLSSAVQRWKERRYVRICKN